MRKRETFKRHARSKMKTALQAKNILHITVQKFGAIKSFTLLLLGKDALN